jgi:hypothetical protein
MRTRLTLILSLLAFGAYMGPVRAQIALPTGNTPFLTTFGDGVQIYKSGSDGGSGFQWNFFAPSANLFTDSTETVLIATHDAGPTWHFLADGSAVVGTKIGQLASPNPDSIPQLLLQATLHSGNGLFNKVSYIQRLDTFGGLAPSIAPTGLNQEADVHYTASYVFATATPEPGPLALLAGAGISLFGFALRRLRRTLKPGM